MTSWLRREGRIALLEAENARMRHALEEIARWSFDKDGMPKPISFAAQHVLGDIAARALYA